MNLRQDEDKYNPMNEPTDWGCIVIIITLCICFTIYHCVKLFAPAQPNP